MVKEENLFKSEVASPELSSFGLSDKLVGAANVPAAESLVKRLEEESNDLERTGKTAIDELNFSDQEYTDLFQARNAMLSPDEMITLRGSDMSSLGEKRLSNVNPNEKIEQMRNRLNAFKRNFHPEFRAGFANDQELLEMAEIKGSKLKECVTKYRENKGAVGQFEHFKTNVLERLTQGDDPVEVSYQILQSAIERDSSDWAKRDLLLAYNLKAISDSDLEAAFSRYQKENIETMDKTKPGFQRDYDYRQEMIQKLHYNVLRTAIKENL